MYKLISCFFLMLAVLVLGDMHIEQKVREKEIARVEFGQRKPFNWYYPYYYQYYYKELRVPSSACYMTYVNGTFVYTCK